MFTRTNWYVIPIVWLPIAAYLGLRSVFQFSGPIPAFTTNPRLPMAALSSLPASSFLKTGICFVIGNIIWTFLEYLLHRFLFHPSTHIAPKLNKLTVPSPSPIFTPFVIFGRTFGSVYSESM